MLLIKVNFKGRGFESPSSPKFLCLFKEYIEYLADALKSPKIIFDPIENIS